MRLLLLGLALVAGGAWGQHSSFSLAPLLPVAPIAVYPEQTQARVTTPVRQTPIRQAPIRQAPIRQSPVRQQSFASALSGSQDPCRPSPCGPNTRCEVSHRGIALCRCLDDFVPDGNTINGCKPQCVTDSECPDDYRCRATKCVRVCVQGACGTNADCDARNHRATCSCPNNYVGDANTRCVRAVVETRSPAPPAPPLDPCRPSPCGTNADCSVRGERPVCTCPIGYEGDPLTNCRRGECIEANDCPGHLTCQRLKCIDPCGAGVCGQQAECVVRTHQPVCSCPRGFVGDPFTRCRRFDPQELCNPSPCGRSTNCKVRNNRAVCSCIENYIRNPLTGCEPEPECVRDTDCPNNLGCRNNMCFAECTAHDDCPSYQACYQLQCVNPCDGACGTGADCKVENHKPICSCPRGYTGHPFESCRPFTPEELCNPSPCGRSTNCKVRNDRAVCSCIENYIGNPLTGCDPSKSPESCPPNNSTFVKVGEECYAVYVETQLDWSAARAKCQSTSVLNKTMDLAMVKSFEQQLSLFEHTKQYYSKQLNFWLGGRTQSPQRQWQWLDGTSIEMGGGRWAPGMPGITDGLCLTVKEGLFLNRHCTDVQAYVCQRTTSET